MLKANDGTLVYVSHGHLAEEYCGVRLELEVLSSAAGFYIGTRDDGGPVSRESWYFRSWDQAQDALDKNSWVQIGL